MQYEIKLTAEFLSWRDSQPEKSRAQIEKRISLIRSEGHFGDHKDLGEDICELRWDSGRRIYYAIIPPKNMIIILGGNKNGQSYDIQQARRIFGKWRGQTTR
jgi:putative addiction module killer protein